jgi:hypothetical protein
LLACQGSGRKIGVIEMVSTQPQKYPMPWGTYLPSHEPCYIIRKIKLSTVKQAIGHDYRFN